ncbi:hypothetical protein ASPZODRAFT_62602 [Penicilliopsis zonata CBS 506.65]|uniref:Uncharacterized protein n=1 Tax=Penicilliopsis zonata CBS 506.65 TaxID=1073090 RepID=A0A1L9SN31_9EURO|nr:hypothetical protein ASPZODRAFT_62602 [Penicilliopsis zonata CBS 506.65]OJJ48526.1 hypothetical protein ASPZODRAFT_62602 [Penicilliopsis zonata CBS 506.65]
MAGKDDSQREQTPSPPQESRPWPEDDNPFVAFRRYADEQISSMLQSVMGLPSMVSPPTPDHWKVFADDNNNNDKYRDLMRREDEAEGRRDRDRSSSSLSSAEDTNDDDDDYNNNNNNNDNQWRSRNRRYGQQHRSSDIFGIDSFFDGPWLNDRFPVSFRLFHPYPNSFFTEAFGETESPMWPMPYLLLSPYSPLHLERRAQYRVHREHGVFSSLMSSLRSASDRDPDEPHWREAFEDLIRLENGKPMLDRPSDAIMQRESGYDWLQGLVKRGSLGQRWQYVPSTADRPWAGITYDSSDSSEDRSSLPNTKRIEPQAQPDVSTEELEHLAEMDLYNRFLEGIEARERDAFRGMPESPLLRFLLEEKRRLQETQGYGNGNGNNQFPLDPDIRGDDTESWLELVSGGNRNSVPDTQPSPETDQAAADQIVSMVTTINRVRLPDGSMKTTTVKTKRFDDGREERDESVEVVNPQSSSPSPVPAEDESKKSGWFWK